MIFGYEVRTRCFPICPLPARHTAERKFRCMLVHASESFVSCPPFTVGHHLKRELISDIDPGMIAGSSVCRHLSGGVLQKQGSLRATLGCHAHIGGTRTV